MPKRYYPLPPKERKPSQRLTRLRHPPLVLAHSHFQLSLVPLLRCVFDASRVDKQTKPGCVGNTETEQETKTKTFKESISPSSGLSL
jgi:hypothetical protein